MLSLFEFSELRALWLLFTQDIESCYRYVEKDGKRCMMNIDPHAHETMPQQGNCC